MPSKVGFEALETQFRSWLREIGPEGQIER